MKYAEFTRRVDHNTKILKDALENNISLVTVASQFYTYHSEPGQLHFSILMRNLHDIIPSVFLGALANVDSNGTDAFIVREDGSIEALEIKTAELDGSKVWKGAHGGLYTGIGTNRTQKAALTSKVNASYKCYTHENLLSKNMRTVLFVTDTNDTITSDTYLDAWELEGSAVVEYLQLSDKRQRTIKLGSFIKKGFRAKTVVPLVGFFELRAVLEISAPYRDDWLVQNGYPI